MQSTEWLPVKDYEGFYEVSTDGQVRSLDHIALTSDGRSVPIRGRVLRPRLTAHGRYVSVALFSNGGRQSYMIHRLVAAAFLPMPSTEQIFVCHNDGNSLNNVAGNLRWGTHAENMRDKRIHGTDYHANRTHCVNGHAFSGDNLRISGGQRVCRTCASISARKSEARKRATL